MSISCESSHKYEIDLSRETHIHKHVRTLRSSGAFYLSFVVDGVERSIGTDQLSDDNILTVQASHVQRGVAVRVEHVNVDVTVEQVLHHRDLSASTGSMQGRHVLRERGREKTSLAGDDASVMAGNKV